MADDFQTWDGSSSVEDRLIRAVERAAKSAGKTSANTAMVRDLLSQATEEQRASWQQMREQFIRLDQTIREHLEEHHGHIQRSVRHAQEQTGSELAKLRQEMNELRSHCKAHAKNLPKGNLFFWAWERTVQICYPDPKASFTEGVGRFMIAMMALGVLALALAAMILFLIRIGMDPTEVFLFLPGSSGSSQLPVP